MTSLIQTCIFRAAMFSLLWWILTSGNPASWLVGIPTIAIATLASVALLPSCAWSPVGIVRFILFFIVHSLRGGADVAWRAFHPGLPIEPIMLDYPLRLEAGRSQVYLVSVINLLPGTLSVSLGASSLKIHTLNAGKNVVSELRSVEHYVALIFGVTLQAPERGECDE